MHRRNPVPALAAGLYLVVAAVSGTAQAQATPEDAKEYRETIMSALGAHVSAISKHVRGLVEDNGFLGDHAQALAMTAAELGYVFPAGSNVDDSEALPAIWEQPEEFAKAVTAAEQATAALAEVASTGDQRAIGLALRDVGASCRGCHDKFRRDDD